jgi:putative ATP-binding cassette transporter
MLKILGQFWRLLALCVEGRGGKLGLVMFVVVVALKLGGVYVSLRLIAWTKDFYSALEAVDAAAALLQIGIFGIIVALNSVRELSSQYINKLLLIRWRRSLTEAAQARWLANKSYWHMAHAGGAVDNPDQRIAEDCRLFISGMLSEALDLITNIVAIFSYVALLWSLSSFPLSLGFIGLDLEIPRYMLWAAFAYVALCSLLTHVLGAPLKSLYIEQQKREADFRFALARMRQNVDEIALLNGEDAERATLGRRFGAIMGNWQKLINRELILGCFTYPYSHTVLRIPLFVALPAFLAGAVNLGGLMEVASAFSNVVTTLSWFIFSYRDLADLVAASSRLDGFLSATRRAGAAGSGFTISDGPHLGLDGVEVTLADGRQLLALDTLRVAPGETVWLKGASGLGKTTLLKALAGLWPHGRGTITLPVAGAFFVPQRSYLPLGTLAEAVAYPALPDTIGEAPLAAALRAVGLGGRVPDLGASVTELGLSGGEQQRLAFARLLLAKPSLALLDEPTAALDVAAEEQLFTLLRRDLPDLALLVVSHREPRGAGPLRIVTPGAAGLPVSQPQPQPA